MDEILDLKSPADWENRPNFRPVLHGKAEDLDKIMGKYDLPRPGPGLPKRTGMEHCGLNACNEGHFRGFLLRLNTGLETIVGRDCSRNKMGAIFEEIEAAFVARETLESRQKILAELQATSQDLIQHAQLLVPKCKAAHDQINAIVNELSGFNGFWLRLQDVARLDGRVMVEVKVTGMTQRGENADLEEAARIQQCQLFFDDTSRHHRKLYLQVIHWLKVDLAAEITTAGDDLKKLGSLTAKAADLRSILTDAANFAKDAQTLLAPSNLRGLVEIAAQQLSRSHRSNALSRALKRLAASDDAKKS